MKQMGLLLYVMQQNLTMGFWTRDKDDIYNCFMSITKANQYFFSDHPLKISEFIEATMKNGLLC